MMLGKNDLGLGLLVPCRLSRQATDQLQELIWPLRQDLLSIHKNGVWSVCLSPPPAEDFDLPANRYDWSFGALR